MRTMSGGPDQACSPRMKADHRAAACFGSRAASLLLIPREPPAWRATRRDRRVLLWLDCTRLRCNRPGIGFKMRPGNDGQRPAVPPNATGTTEVAPLRDTGCPVPFHEVDGPGSSQTIASALGQGGIRRSRLVRGLWGGNARRDESMRRNELGRPRWFMGYGTGYFLRVSGSERALPPLPRIEDRGDTDGGGLLPWADCFAAQELEGFRRGACSGKEKSGTFREKGELIAASELLARVALFEGNRGRGQGTKAKRPERRRDMEKDNAAPPPDDKGRRARIHAICCLVGRARRQCRVATGQKADPALEGSSFFFFFFNPEPNRSRKRGFRV